MKKVWLLGLGALLVIGVIGFAGCSSGSIANGEGIPDIKVNLGSQQEGIWVTGNGEVAAVPDVAVLRLGVEAQEPSVAEAQSRAAEAMDKVRTALTENGVAEKDIQTQQYNIHRVTRWDNVKEQEIIIGYRVTNVVSAKIREIEKVGSIIDSVAVAGGDLTRVDSIGFSVDDPSPYYEQARQKAVADAGIKARQIAELAGIKLGKPTYISESSYPPSPIYRSGMLEKAAGAPMVETPISPGEMEISLTLQIAYEILD